MKSLILLISSLACLGLNSLSAQNADSSPLKNELHVFVVETNDQGTEQLVAREKIDPGEIIEYQFNYENVSSTPLNEIKAKGLIPEATVYLEGSTSPTETYTIEFSLDGTNFSVPPLYYTVKKEDGSSEEVIATPEMYRALRWIIPSLDAGESQRLSYRVKVR